ncbi:MAG TPA: hypothetical protein VF260_11960 [Bacilli bacterium]
MYWDGWNTERIVILFVSLAYLLIGIQVTMFHYRQNFHRKIMWAPVLASPLFFVCGMAYVFYRVDWLHSLFVVLMWVGVIAGVVGFYMHTQGVRVRVGGWSVRNFLIGPPVILPLLFGALGALGLIAAYMLP